MLPASGSVDNHDQTAAKPNGRLGRTLAELLSVFKRHDLVVYFLFVGFLFVSFEQHYDIFHTMGSAVTYLNGHFRDFYEINAAALSYTNYLPSTYIVFAIWGIPLKLLGLLKEPTLPVGMSFLWFKLMTTGVYFGAGGVLYRIGLELGLTRRGALLLSVAWVTTPIAVFSQFIFGQYDVLTVIFTLLGFLYYLRERNRLAAFYFGIAITFKYFPLFVFLPLLLLTEKRPRELFVNLAIVLAPILVQVLLYVHSDAFRQGVLGFGAAGRVFLAVFRVGDGDGFSILFFLWFVLCGWAYLQPVLTKERLKVMAVNASVGAFSGLFLLLDWHPDWLLVVTPFLVMSAVLRKHRTFFLVLDVVMMVAFVAYTVRTWPHNVDQHMFVRGVFGSLNPALADRDLVYMMRELPPISFTPNTLWMALFNAALVTTGFAWLWRGPAHLDLTVDRELSFIPLLRMRFVVGVLIFLLPAIVVYLITFLRT